jgi:glycosyltransferase involved in cell wall biosynthesis
MMVRNGEDCIRQSLESVLPYVKKAIVVLDSRSTDKTKEIVEGLMDKYLHLEFLTYQVKEPYTELVEIRNLMLYKTDTKFGWIVDSDEIYPKEVVEGVAKTLSRQNGVLAYGFTSWGVWNGDKAHAQSSKRPTMRIYRNFKGLKWEGTFGKEKLKLGDIDLCYDYIGLPFKYIHLTHLKSDDWRKEMGFVRVADGRALVELPENIKIIVKDYVKERMSNVQ